MLYWQAVLLRCGVSPKVWLGVRNQNYVSLVMKPKTYVKLGHIFAYFSRIYQSKHIEWIWVKKTHPDISRKFIAEQGTSTGPPEVHINAPVAASHIFPIHIVMFFILFHY